MIHLLFTIVALLLTRVPSTPQAQDAATKERERRAAREQFSQNFRELQLLGIDLLKAHEAGSLKPNRLTKDVKAIQKRARALRSLTVLGEPAVPVPPIEPDIKTPESFDRSIRHLAELIRDFANNPIHKNAKVFNTDQAAQAASDLVEIAELAKAIGTCARDYTARRIVVWRSNSIGSDTVPPFTPVLVK